MKQVIVFPRGQLTAKDKERLTRHGIIALEADDPSKVVTVMPNVPMLSADEITISAAVAIRSSTTATSTFGAELARRITEKGEKK